MCESIRRTLIGGAVVLAVATAPVHAQRLSPLRSVAEERARVALLEQRLAESKRREEIADSVRKSQLPADTVRVGTLVILAGPGSRMVIDSAARLAWPAIERRFGPAVSALTSSPLVSMTGVTNRRGRPTPFIEAGISSGGGIERSQNADLDAHAVEGMTAAVTDLASAIMTSTLSSRLRLFIGGTLGATGNSRVDLERVHRQLLTAGMQVDDRCFAGDIRACSEALGLTAVDDPVTRWFTPEQRRRFAMSAKATGTRVIHDACVGGSDQACVAFFHQTSPPDPLSPSARMTLVQIALDRGGVDAFTRLRSDSSMDIASSIARTAGMPIDDLVREWRNQVVAARPRTVVASTGSVLAAVGWITLLGAVSLKGSRWR